MLPLQFIVIGTPVSHQARNRKVLRSWRADVAQATRAAVEAGAAPVEDDVEIEVVYYHDEEAPNLPDEDNMLKPVQDALQGIVYVDDSQISDGTCRRRNLDSSFEVRRMSRVLADGFVQGEEFIHVTVRPAPDPRVLRQ